jgi:hypothetical protein
MIRPITLIQPLKTDTKEQGLAIPGYKELDRLINDTANAGNPLVNTEVEDLFRYSHNSFESSAFVKSLEEVKEVSVTAVESKGIATEEIKGSEYPYEKELIDAAIDVQSIYSEFVEPDKFPKTVRKQVTK